MFTLLLQRLPIIQNSQKKHNPGFKTISVHRHGIMLSSQIKRIFSMAITLSIHKKTRTSWAQTFNSAVMNSRHGKRLSLSLKDLADNKESQPFHLSIQL